MMTQQKDFGRRSGNDFANAVGSSKKKLVRIVDWFVESCLVDHSVESLPQEGIAGSPNRSATHEAIWAGDLQGSSDGGNAGYNRRHFN